MIAMHLLNSGESVAIGMRSHGQRQQPVSDTDRCNNDARRSRVTRRHTSDFSQKAEIDLIHHRLSISIDHRCSLTSWESERSAESLSVKCRYCIILYSMARHRYAKFAHRSVQDWCPQKVGKKPTTATNPLQFGMASLQHTGDSVPET